jgi:hypothetical protein
MFGAWIARVRDALWSLRHRPGAVLVVVAVLSGGIVGWIWRSGSTDPVRDEVETAVVLLQRDFGANADALDSTYRRTFTGVENGVMVGTVTRIVPHGTCWGFDLRIPASWLADGTGQVAVGDVRRFPAPACMLAP